MTTALPTETYPAVRLFVAGGLWSSLENRWSGLETTCDEACYKANHLPQRKRMVIPTYHSYMEPMEDQLKYFEGMADIVYVGHSHGADYVIELCDFVYKKLGKSSRLVVLLDAKPQDKRWWQVNYRYSLPAGTRDGVCFYGSKMMGIPFGDGFEEGPHTVNIKLDRSHPAFTTCEPFKNFLFEYLSKVV